MRNNLDASRNHIYKTENRLKYTCAIFKCFVNAFTNCLHITRLLLSSFVGLWGGINFNFLYSALFFPLPFAGSVSIFSSHLFFCFGKREKIETNTFSFGFFFHSVSYITCVAAFSILGSFQRNLLPLQLNVPFYRSNHNENLFMCYLHTIYSDFPQFKINYASQICKIEQSIYLLFSSAIKV